MRDRLIELIESARYWDTSKEIADRLLAEGVIVPPCKVGQTVYCMRYDKARKPCVKPLEVNSIIMWRNKTFSVFTTKEDFWNRTAFTSKEEAERALAERREG